MAFQWKSKVGPLESRDGWAFPCVVWIVSALSDHPGWDEWHGWAGSYADGKIYENGALNDYDLSRRHETDILGSKADSFVRHAKGSPWFAYVAFNSPHNPTYTEPGYADDYDWDRGLPKSPAFDEEDVSEKPAWVRRLPRLSDQDTARYERKHRDRLRAMRSVDDAVAGLLRTLRQTGQIDNTYVVLWNDNGYHMGQHGIPEGKRTAYEEDVRSCADPAWDAAPRTKGWSAART